MYKRTVTIRKTVFGAGKPKICVPLVAENRKELNKALAALDDSVPYDLVEWRADFFEAPEDAQAVRTALEAVCETIGERPLLYTFRTAAEGGEKPASFEAYSKMLLAAAETGLVDLVDVELMSASEEEVWDLVDKLHERKVAVIGSNHDFHKTPETGEMLARLHKMQDLGMDITKIAVMPNDRGDVLRLLETAVCMSEEAGNSPCVTMSMGKTGVISRIAGAFDGSAITFATAGAASAPGQIPASDMAQILSAIE